jgi:hypothetical protein
MAKIFKTTVQYMNGREPEIVGRYETEREAVEAILDYVGDGGSETDPSCRDGSDEAGFYVWKGSRRLHKFHNSSEAADWCIEQDEADEPEANEPDRRLPRPETLLERAQKAQKDEPDEVVFPVN